MLRAISLTRQKPDRVLRLTCVYEQNGLRDTPPTDSRAFELRRGRMFLLPLRTDYTTVESKSRASSDGLQNQTSPVKNLFTSETSLPTAVRQWDVGQITNAQHLQSCCVALLSARCPSLYTSRLVVAGLCQHAAQSWKRQMLSGYLHTPSTMASRHPHFHAALAHHLVNKDLYSEFILALSLTWAGLQVESLAIVPTF